MQLDELQERSRRFFVEGGRVEVSAEEAGRVTFSGFDPEHLRAATDLAGELSRLAAEAPTVEEGLAAALDRADAEVDAHPSGLVEWALGLFITHDERGARLVMPSIEERAFDELAPSAVTAAEGAVGPEAVLDWYREDRLTAAHHEHWHMVYPGRGVDLATGQRVYKDRHGELFFYMHQQMLARYDTERFSAGLPRVAPLSDYRAPIAEAYNPSPGFEHEARPAGASLLAAHGEDAIARHETTRDRLFQAASSMAFHEASTARVPMTAHLLGATTEASIDSVDREFYGGLHNAGHRLIAEVTGTGSGAMAGFRTAIRDPAFYRWHKHIDDVCFRYQEALPPNDFADHPAVLLRNGPEAGRTALQSPDVFVVREPGLPPPEGPAGRAAWADATFGGDHWDELSFDEAVDALRTWFETQELRGPAGQRITVPVLDHDDFAYVLRLENRSDAPSHVTLRLFLAAVEVAEDRRTWIEMDKFDVELAAGERKVVYRPAAYSSVVRKPVERPPRPPSHNGDRLDDTYCQCGWPYHLLLPSGRPAPGLPVRLCAVVTDFAADQIPSQLPTECGSMSFCGLRNDTYPDKREMGYPFARRFPDGIAETIRQMDSMAGRDFSIIRLDSPPGGVR